MAATRIVEEERGSFTGTPRNPHQGYYAGDFGGSPSAFDGFARATRHAASSRRTGAGWFGSTSFSTR